MSLVPVTAATLGKLHEGVVRPKESIESVWEHIEKGLEALATNGKTDQTSLNENGLTQRLIHELETVDGYQPFYFQKEEMEDDSDGHSPRNDISAHARAADAVVVYGVSYGVKAKFLVLEAKRLPAPEKRREREYVIGATNTQKVYRAGGIERFKLGDHGPALKEVGMIGYVQRHSFDHWRAEINRWIDDLIAASQQGLSWDTKDQLELETSSARLARFKSHNLRKTDNQRLLIRHIWISLDSSAA